MTDISNHEKHKWGLVPDAERLLEALPTPVFGVDASERIRFVNAAAAEMMAVAGRGLLGRRLQDVFGIDAPLVALARRAIVHDVRVGEADLPLQGPSFSLGRVSVLAAPVDERGFIAIVLNPVQKTRSGANSGTINSAARTLAHEVRNPLAGIRAAAQLISRNDDPESAALAKLICDEVDRMRRLTDRIDPFGAFTPPQFERFNIHEALDRVRQLVSSGTPGIKIVTQFDVSLPHVRGDMDQMIQAFLNIAKNAAEAVSSQDNGRITFSTAFRSGVHVRSAPSGQERGQLEVKISDNGPGVDPEIADRLFEPFATTKSGGMGLGLSVSADIIARHDGHVEVDTEPGRTTFKILLPIETKENGL